MTGPDVTSLSRASLEAEVIRLRQAQEAGGIGLFTIDLREDLLIPTPEFCRLYGLPVVPQCPAALIEERVLEEDRDRISSTQSRRSGAIKGETEYRVIRADTGALRWIARKGETEFGPDGTPLRFIGIARDITAEREARDALTLSEERYRALFDAIDDGFCIIEFFDGPHGPLSDYMHIVANAGYERHTGIAGIVGKTLRDVAPDDADGWLELYGSVLRTGKGIRFERRFIEAGRHIEVSAARVEPAERRQVSVLFRDIEARKQAENALRASEAIARANIERVQLALSAGAIIGTWFWDIPGDRFTVDEAFARAFGLDPALGRDGLSLEQVIATVHPDDKAGLRHAMDEGLRRGGAYAHQYRVRRADGHYYWIEANGRVDLAPDGTPFSFPGVLLDIEQRRTVEQERDRASDALRKLNETLEQRVADRTAELMRAEERLRQSQKMEAVGQLTGGLAHDFNNLLAGVSGALEMMNRRLSQGRPNDMGKYAEIAQDAVRRAAALTHRLLAFSRRQTLDPKPTDAHSLVLGMAELIQRTVGPAITLETLNEPGLWTVLADQSQLENALLNLCLNARDALPHGGRITIETANELLDDAAARALGLPPGPYVALRVTDNGSGMTADTVAKAFDPFFTTKPLGQGTGLGLSMIYGFATQSGGQVRISSQVDQGTSVTLHLPRYVGDAQGDARHGDQAALPASQHGETVLVVDDEINVRLLVTDMLEELGYRVIDAEDGAKGLAILQSGERIDLLISDVGLPGGMNGRQMAEAGRLARPGLKVLFITGYAESAVIGDDRLEPGMQVLTKPFTVEALGSRVRAMIEG
ncbi:PAS domain-containing hybrid sensor histidine kinase/response regulator [Novosphingobium rosa]|uniref:PAS domain-containing hybrid sensor histidine kinase/response regulator n=1 Tax=Novosphingobium rosa TaxID=76978 RepID=UPI00082DE7E1|nr:PAS domain-containing hybrid sensor histidine kinase/response regulator [Novosphingobium rosa]